MAYPPITALPAVPSRNSPSTFSTLMDAFLAAFPQFRTELNALAAYLDTLALATGPGLFLNGSAASPAVAFASDTNTGLYRIGADTIGIAVGGVEVARFTSAGIAGPAVQASLTDTTAGRLLLAGAYGWGAEAVPLPGGGLDIDGITVTGNYQINATVISASPNIWSKAAISSSSLLHFGRDASNAAQIMVNRSSAVMAIRTRSLGTWGPWREIFHQGSVLGTVSQASGVPTGGLIERGSNANGEYVRWADGTQICSATLTGSAGAGVAWTFPAAFSAAPNVGGTVIATVLSALCLDAAPSATAVTVSARDKTDARRADTIHIRATGRWF